MQALFVRETRRLMGVLGLVILTSLVLPMSMAMGQAVDTRHQIAAYGSAIATHPLPAGWQVLWNPDGPVGTRAYYQPLTYDAASRRYGVLDEQGRFQRNKPSASSYLNYQAGDKDRSHPVFLIASYTMPADARGSVWLNHVNVQNRSFSRGNVAKVYVNDKLVVEKDIPQSRRPTVFQVELGALKKGDVIQLAAGPAIKDTNAAGKLQFVIEDVPTGQAPGQLVNLLSPDIDEPAPQFEGNGDIKESFKTIHETQNALMLENNAQLIFMGDSITYRWPYELLEKHLGQYKPTKMAVGGDWTQNLLWRVQHSNLDKLHPHGVVILIGTNNLSNGFTPDEVAKGIQKIIQTVHKKSPDTRVLILGILPRGGDIKEKTNRLVEEVNMKAGDLADGKRVFFLDVTSALVEPDGSITKEVMPDKLHVAMPGFERWMQKLEPAIHEMMNR